MKSTEYKPARFLIFVISTENLTSSPPSASTTAPSLGPDPVSGFGEVRRDGFGERIEDGAGVGAEVWGEDRISAREVRGGVEGEDE